MNPALDCTDACWCICCKAQFSHSSRVLVVSSARPWGGYSLRVTDSAVNTPIHTSALSVYHTHTHSSRAMWQWYMWSSWGTFTPNTSEVVNHLSLTTSVIMLKWGVGSDWVRCNRQVYDFQNIPIFGDRKTVQGLLWNYYPWKWLT